MCASVFTQGRVKAAALDSRKPPCYVSLQDFNGVVTVRPPSHAVGRKTKVGFKGEAGASRGPTVSSSGDLSSHLSM